MRFAWTELGPLYVLHRQRYPLPHRCSIRVIIFQQRIGPLRSLDRGILAVLADEHAGDAVNVKVGSHFQAGAKTGLSIIPMERAIYVQSPASGLMLIRAFAAHRTGLCRLIGSYLSNSCPNLLPYPCYDDATLLRAANNFSFDLCFGLLAKFGNETVGCSINIWRLQRHVTGSPTGIRPWPINWVGSCGLKCAICPIWAAWVSNRDAFPCGINRGALLARLGGVV